MRPCLRIQPGLVAISCCLALLASGFGPALSDEPAATPAESEGRELARQLRQQKPAESSTNKAVLKLRNAQGRRRTVPLSLIGEVGEDQWKVTYKAVIQDTEEILRISHKDDQPPRYEFAKVSKTDGADAKFIPVEPSDLGKPFAGTDFWMGDLGLEFLSWPAQRILRSEPHSGVMCRVLESRNPKPEGYARVVSWIELRHMALLGAEAYDSQGLVIKKFTISSVSRDGVREMKMRDVRADTVTELEYITERSPNP
jgi:hypothetical protein